MEGVIAAQLAPKALNSALVYQAPPQLQPSQSWDGNRSYYERINANRLEARTKQDMAAGFGFMYTAIPGEKSVVDQAAWW